MILLWVLYATTAALCIGFAYVVIKEVIKEDEEQ